MAKRSSALREPSRTATPEEVAEDRRRSEKARLASLGNVPPAPDPALAAAVDQVSYDDMDQLLLEGRWIPSTPAEIGAAFRALAGYASTPWDRCSEPTIPSLAEHVLALESLIVGQDVHFLTDLNGDPTGCGKTRVAFQLLYQRFERGENAGLHERLSEAEARVTRLERRMEGHRHV